MLDLLCFVLDLCLVAPYNMFLPQGVQGKLVWAFVMLLPSLDETFHHVANVVGPSMNPPLSQGRAEEAGAVNPRERGIHEIVTLIGLGIEACHLLAPGVVLLSHVFLLGMRPPPSDDLFPKRAPLASVRGKKIIHIGLGFEGYAPCPRNFN